MIALVEAGMLNYLNLTVIGLVGTVGGSVLDSSGSGGTIRNVFG